jgi:hypothetical protein
VLNTGEQKDQEIRKDLEQKILSLKYWKEKRSDASVLKNIKIESSDNRLVWLKDVIGNSPRIVMVYSELNCGVCVDNEVENLKKIAVDVGSENIIFLSSYNNPRDMWTFKRLNKLDMDIYNLHYQKLGIPIEDDNTPFIFLIDSTLTSTMVFMPIKEVPTYSEQYYTLMKQRFFNR